MPSWCNMTVNLFCLTSTISIWTQEPRFTLIFNSTRTKFLTCLLPRANCTFTKTGTPLLGLRRANGVLPAASAWCMALVSMGSIRMPLFICKIWRFCYLAQHSSHHSLHGHFHSFSCPNYLRLWFIHSTAPQVNPLCYHTYKKVLYASLFIFPLHCD